MSFVFCELPFEDAEFSFVTFVPYILENKVMPNIGEREREREREAILSGFLLEIATSH